jgi:uncharacterized RDD family membrane protein YckC
MNYAPRSQRIIGQVLDAFIGFIPIILGVVVSSFNEVLALPLMIGGFGWSLFYYFFADGFSGGQSYGKRLLGMRVVNADDGLPCTFGKSFLRNLLLYILGPIDWLFIFGERHQRLGDKAAGTIVVSVYTR